MKDPKAVLTTPNVEIDVLSMASQLSVAVENIEVKHPKG